jgi:organic radical activating enzyme
MNEKEPSWPVMEQYLTIQGEGANTGRSAYFIRLAGCDVGCVWCDVKESWPSTGFPAKTAPELCADVLQSGAKNVVITGGEPSMYNLDALCHVFKQAGLLVWIETSGSHAFSGSWDWICLSPKKFKSPKSEWLSRANEFKVVVYHPSDLLWAQGFLPELPSDCALFVQPEWDRRDKISADILRFIHDNPQWRLSLQTHKYVGIP